jgi:hypothetical protein
VTLNVALLVPTVGLGLALAWQAWQASQGRPSPAFAPGRVWPLALLFLLAVGAGQAVLSLNVLPTLLFPPLHIVAASLPPLIILGWVGRRLQGMARRRDIVLQVGSGALLSTLLAFALEGGLILILAAGSLAYLLLTPGGPELVDRLTEVLESLTWLQDPENLVPLFLSPGLIAAATLVVAGLVPLVEEAVKTVGVGLLGYRRPGRAEAFAWGLAGGAGFALLEGLLNTTGSLALWSVVILVRVGATLLHCLTGALMGLAWYEILARRRWGRSLGLYAGSVALHSLWNILSVGISVLSMGSTSPEAGGQVLAGLGMGAMVLALMAITLGLGLGLAGLTARLGKSTEGEASR